VHHEAVRQLGAGPVVVGHDHVHSRRPGGGHLGHRRDPAVDGHEQVHSGRREPLHRGGREPVAVVEAARDLPGGIGAERTQGADEDRRRADAVHVVIAVHGDPGPALNVSEDQVAGGREPRERERIVPFAGAQEAAGLLGIRQTTAHEDGCQGRGDAE
jgi:hypothetical protein